MKKENLLETNIQDGSGKREVTMRKSSLRESRNYGANSNATAVNSNDSDIIVDIKVLAIIGVNVVAGVTFHRLGRLSDLSL